METVFGARREFVLAFGFRLSDLRFESNDSPSLFFLVACFFHFCYYEVLCLQGGIWEFFIYVFFLFFFFGRMGKKKTEGEYGEWAGMIILLLQTESDVLLLLNEWNKEMIDRFSYLNTWSYSHACVQLCLWGTIMKLRLRFEVTGRAGKGKLMRWNYLESTNSHNWRWDCRCYGWGHFKLLSCNVSLTLTPHN